MTIFCVINLNIVTQIVIIIYLVSNVKAFDQSICQKQGSSVTMYTDSNGVQLSLQEAYERDGYVTGLEIFESDSSEMVDYLNELNKLQSLVSNELFVGQEINPHFAYKFLWDLATHPRIISILNEIFSENLALLATTIFTKYPQKIKNKNEYVGYHQDIRYWGLDPPKAIGVWFAFDNVTMDNGPMIYIPQTHKNGIYVHQIMNNTDNLLIGKQEIPLNLFDIKTAVPVTLKSGSVAIHDGSLIHGSGPNLSDQRRCGFVLRYIDLETKVLKKEDDISEDLEYRDHPQYTAHNDEWRRPTVICGEPTTNLQQFYANPSCFMENPEIPQPVKSNSSRYFTANDYCK